jgi:hypothetical protein
MFVMRKQSLCNKAIMGLSNATILLLFRCYCHDMFRSYDHHQVADRLMMIVWLKHAMAITPEEEKKNCCIRQTHNCFVNYTHATGSNTTVTTMHGILEGKVFSVSCHIQTSLGFTQYPFWWKARVLSLSASLLDHEAHCSTISSAKTYLSVPYLSSW